MRVLRDFEAVGFRALSADSAQPDDAHNLIARVELSEKFAPGPVAELVLLAGHYVVQRA